MAPIPSRRSPYATNISTVPSLQLAEAFRILPFLDGKYVYERVMARQVRAVLRVRPASE
jgi:hypothetical protein